MEIGINPSSELKRLLYQWIWHKADIGQVGWEPLLAFLLIFFVIEHLKSIKYHEAIKVIKLFNALITSMAFLLHYASL